MMETLQGLFNSNSYSVVAPGGANDLDLPTVVVVGASAVGKTSFLQRLQDVQLSQPRRRDHIRTAECILTPKLPLRFNAHVLDRSETMEQERLECCFSKASTLFFVFSVKDPSSINFLEQWLRRNGPQTRELLNKQARVFTVGNKCDYGSTFPPSLSNDVDTLKWMIESNYKQDVEEGAENNIIATVMEPIATEMVTEDNSSRSSSFRVIKNHMYCMNDIYNPPGSSTSPKFHQKKQ